MNRTLQVRPAATVPTDGGGGIPAPGAGIDLRLDGNLGSAPGADLLQALAGDPELLRAYPQSGELEQALAQRHGVSPDRIAVGAGADEVLDRVCRSVLAPGRTAVLPVPTFEMIERYVALAGARAVRVPWVDGPWPRAAVLSAIDADTALVAIVAPNNPTGLMAGANDVDAVAAAAPHALLLVDGAYAEYAEEDLTAAALRWPNAVAVRTLSKAFGLAGLRVGYAIAHPEVARWLRAIGSPFTVGRLQRAAAIRRLAGCAHAVRTHVDAVRQRRAELTSVLAAAGARPLPSQANFVFARPADPMLLRDLLAGLGIAVRAFACADVPGLAGGVRITVPEDPPTCRRLEAALQAALQPEAFVLDLDGVLADVVGRRALVAAEILAALAAERPLAVVTGCPRKLCESLLARYGFEAHVRAVVAAEDGPGKPDPFPVRRALQQLGVRSAWMLGDHVVDVQAARAAGAVPLAIVPRGPDAPTRAAELLAAGAARLVDGPAALPGLLAGLRANPTPN